MNINYTESDNSLIFNFYPHSSSNDKNKLSEARLPIITEQALKNLSDSVEVVEIKTSQKVYKVKKEDLIDFIQNEINYFNTGTRDNIDVMTKQILQELIDERKDQNFEEILSKNLTEPVPESGKSLEVEAEKALYAKFSFDTILYYIGKIERVMTPAVDLSEQARTTSQSAGRQEHSPKLKSQRIVKKSEPNTSSSPRARLENQRSLRRKVSQQSSVTTKKSSQIFNYGGFADTNYYGKVANLYFHRFFSKHPHLKEDKAVVDNIKLISLWLTIRLSADEPVTNAFFEPRDIKAINELEINFLKAIGWDASTTEISE